MFSYKKNIHLSLLVFIISMVVTACSESGLDDNHDHPELKTGKQLFDFHCSVCHGVSGKGKFIEGIPANALTKKNRMQIIQKIQSGDGTKSKMPVFKTMSKDEANRIVDHLFELQQELLNQ